MIPLSVRMTGWMRYRDEQVADFSNGNLISICGENGAGKSSIFDAITFALYGQHRLGKMHAAELISEDLDRLSVEFEFEAAGERYLVRRSRGKKENERDQSLWVWDGAGEWAQVAGSEKEDSLRRTLDQIVRLSHEAFTSSFLLQQGSATAFLDADPKPRFDIISGLIGLKEYEALEKRAREAQKNEKVILDKLTEDLKGFEGVDDDAIARLRDEVVVATQRDAAATEAAQNARALLADAQRYTSLAADLATLDQQIAGAEALIAERERIENDADLFENLTRAIDAVGRIATSLADAQSAEAAAEGANKKAAAIDVPALTAAHAAASAEIAAAEKAAVIAETSAGAATKSERAAFEFAQIAAAVLEGRTLVAGFDEQLKQLDAQLRKASAAQTSLAKDTTAADVAAKAADSVLDAARNDAAEATALSNALKEQLAERRAAAKESTCARCGQPIDKKAAKQQIDELAAQLASAQQSATTTIAAEKAAVSARTAARRRLDEIITGGRSSEQQFHRAEAERGSATSGRERAITLVAEHEGKLNGRLKDVAAAVAAHAAAESTLRAAESALSTARKRRDAAAVAESTARSALTTANDRRQALEADEREHRAVAAGHRRAAEAAAAQIASNHSQELATSAVEDPAGTLAGLRAAGEKMTQAPERKTALDRAIQDHASWTGQRTATQKQIDAIPAAHRIDERQARTAASDADTAATAARDALHFAQQQLTTLEARIDELRRMVEGKARAEIRMRRLRKLVTLLGKNGLQGMLVLDALAAITNHANAFLQRLTGGTLQLQIRRDGDALELQAIDSTCMREGRSVKALSGSQKFRCAVAVASGIGQYAGAGGMRSIVIDEGFGSLDQAGQQLMVEELKQLATHMDKVIVVSHLDSFTDPENFPDRIIVETAGTASVIRRVS